MYTNHFSLQSLPFENVCNPACFFEQGDYSRVLNRMIDSLRAGRGLMVVVGPIGTGKTTLSQKLMVSVPDKTRIIWLGEPPVTSEELLLFLTQELHINPEASGRIFVLRDIKDYLINLNNTGNRCLLIIDEVHKISDDVLECVRLLNNLEEGGIKFIQMILIGQEEFLDKLNKPNLESFKQRIAWLEAIGKMTPLQTHEYILHRLQVAGSRSRIFTDDAIETVVNAARGTPRLVNTFCDRALRVSYESNKTIVDLDSVRRAADEIGLGSEVFLWLLNQREEKTEENAPLPVSPLTEHVRPVAPEPRRIEAMPSNSFYTAPLAQKNSTWASSWTLPILLLCASILLLMASLWFYSVNT
jgi:type II secretory pathway predicted ATPase ExeA